LIFFLFGRRQAAGSTKVDQPVVKLQRINSTAYTASDAAACKNEQNEQEAHMMKKKRYKPRRSRFTNGTAVSTTAAVHTAEPEANTLSSPKQSHLQQVSQDVHICDQGRRDERFRVHHHVDYAAVEHGTGNNI
jgi:hypothetical protein